MDANYINPFLESIAFVLPQLGITDIKRGNIRLRDNTFNSSGIVVNVGIVGELKGNVAYSVGIEEAKKIASTMMGGMPVTEFDEMAQSAITELTNMLTANAATALSNSGVLIDISTPTLIYGNFHTQLKGKQVICIEMLLNDMIFEVNISIDKC